jgi:hypothetical protein
MTASLLLGAAAAAATTSVECGLFGDYVAPDPIGVVDGSITFGLTGSPEPIAADATLVPPTDTKLSGLAGGAPTALTVVRDTGVITSLAFASRCTIVGDVDFVPDLFGPGADGYTVADRLFVPVGLMDINDGLAALIPTAAANGTPLTLAFTIDVSSGAPSAFDAALSLVGLVTSKPNGDILVGDARLPGSVISDAARAALREARRLGVEATVAVTGEGAPDGSPSGVAMAISLEVTFDTPAPSPPAVPDTAIRPLPGSAIPLVLLLTLLALVVLSTLRTRASRH